MTAAQKTAKANFKKAIEYRKKTGVSLKEAFAHVYGKKVGAAPKKKAVKKKAAPKKAAKKVVKKAAPKKVGNVTLKKANYYKGDDRFIIMNDGVEHLKGKPFFKDTAKEIASALKKVKAKRKAAAKKIGATTKKRKPISEQSVLNKIHKVKDQVNQLDELQHKHMIGSIDKYKNTMKEVKLYDAALRKVSDNFKGLSAGEKARVKRVKKKLIDARNELKTHAAQLKKTF
jgi:hypothetical protein